MFRSIKCVPELFDMEILLIEVLLTKGINYFISVKKEREKKKVIIKKFERMLGTEYIFVCCREECLFLKRLR